MNRIASMICCAQFRQFFIWLWQPTMLGMSRRLSFIKNMQVELTPLHARSLELQRKISMPPQREPKGGKQLNNSERTHQSLLPF